MIYLCNTHTPQMLEWMNCGEYQDLRFVRISARDAGCILRHNAFRSFFGHSRSAYHLSRYLRVTIPVSRGTITLREHDLLLVAAIQSKRAWEAGYKSCPGWRFYLISIVKKGKEQKETHDQQP